MEGYVVVGLLPGLLEERPPGGGTGAHENGMMPVSLGPHLLERAGEFDALLSLGQGRESNMEGLIDLEEGGRLLQGRRHGLATAGQADREESVPRLGAAPGFALKDEPEEHFGHVAILLGRVDVLEGHLEEAAAHTLKAVIAKREEEVL